MPYPSRRRGHETRRSEAHGRAALGHAALPPCHPAATVRERTFGHPPVSVRCSSEKTTLDSGWSDGYTTVEPVRYRLPSDNRIEHDRRCPYNGPKGKVVQIHRGPAAVIGDERHDEPFVTPTLCRWGRGPVCGEGVVSRMIRKPEDLPMIDAQLRGALGVRAPRSSPSQSHGHTDLSETVHG